MRGRYTILLKHTKQTPYSVCGQKQLPRHLSRISENDQELNNNNDNNNKKKMKERSFPMGTARAEAKRSESMLQFGCCKEDTVSLGQRAN